MNHNLAKIKDGILMGIGILGTMFVGVYAYNYIEVSGVNTGEVLTASKFNQMIENDNYLKEKVDGLGGAGLDFHDTDEVWTGGYDKETGKKVYKKWVDFGYGPNATVKSVNHNIVNYGKTIKAHWYSYSSVGIFYSEASGDYVYVDDTKVNFRSSVGNRSTYKIWIEFYYTKTTD